VVGRRLQRQGVGGEGLGFLGGDRQAPQALGKGARRSRATALSKGIHSLAEEVGSGAELFVDEPEPQDKDHERVPETGEALLYVAMSRLMVRRLARL
jgi:hypothetical protein